MREFKPIYQHWAEPFRLFVPEGAALQYARETLADGTVSGIELDTLVEGLEWSATCYWQGTAMPLILDHQRSERTDWRKRGFPLAARALAVPPKHRPRDWAADAFIRAMIHIAVSHDMLGFKGFTGTNSITGEDEVRRFQRWILGWLALVDSGRTDLGSRGKLREAIKRYKDTV